MISKLLPFAALIAFGASQAVPTPPSPPAPPNPTPTIPTTTGGQLPNIDDTLLYIFRHRDNNDESDRYRDDDGDRHRDNDDETKHFWDDDGDRIDPFTFDGEPYPGAGQRDKRQMEEAIAPIGSDISIDDGEPGENPEPVAPENRAGDNPEDDDGGDGLGRARRHLDEDGEPDNREGESVDDPEGAAPVEPEEDFDDGGQRKKRQDAAAAARPVNPCTRKDCPDNFDCVVRRVCPRPRQCRLVARCVRDRDNTRSKEND